MTHPPINHSDVPIRLFKSDFLEFFSHIHPVTIVIVWLPVVIYFIIQGILHPGMAGSFLFIPLGLLLGIFLWTFTEYTLHRFVFHLKPRKPWQERVTFLFHGVHHAQPQLKTRLVMPPVVSIPMALLTYGLIYLVLQVVPGSGVWINPIFAGLLIGYLIYDLTHYATHHFPMRVGYLKYIKRYHNQHHYKTPDQRFGVSSPLWDIVFGTKPAG